MTEGLVVTFILRGVALFGRTSKTKTICLNNLNLYSGNNKNARTLQELVIDLSHVSSRLNLLFVSP